jgi:hypothetical protein
MRIPSWLSNVGLYMFLFGGGFFLFSMLAWRGFYLVDRNSLIPWMRLQSEATLASIYWWNYVVLALTVVSLVIGIVGLVAYLFAEPKPQEK